MTEKGSGIRRVITGSTAETQALAGRLAKSAARVSPLVIGLLGELGAGKTAFVQGFVAALPGGAGLYVTSPTFAIAKRYPTRPAVMHMDLYRIGSMTEMEEIGYREAYFGDHLTIVEWMDRVPEAIPDDWIEIRLAVLPSDEREITLRPHGQGPEHVVDRCFHDV